jgi:hypothetical protein
MAESHSDADATCTEGGNISIAIIGSNVDVKTPDNQNINETTLDDAVYTHLEEVNKTKEAINTRYKIYANYHSRNTQYKAAFTLCATANLPDLHPECHT